MPMVARPSATKKAQRAERQLSQAQRRPAAGGAPAAANEPARLAAGVGRGTGAEVPCGRGRRGSMGRGQGKCRRPAPQRCHTRTSHQNPAPIPSTHLCQLRLRNELLLRLGLVWRRRLGPPPAAARAAAAGRGAAGGAAGRKDPNQEQDEANQGQAAQHDAGDHRRQHLLCRRAAGAACSRAVGSGKQAGGYARAGSGPGGAQSALHSFPTDPPKPNKGSHPAGSPWAGSGRTCAPCGWRSRAHNAAPSGGAERCKHQHEAR